MLSDFTSVSGNVANGPNFGISLWSAILVLFLMSRPPAILPAVIAIIVDAIYGFTCRFFTHVSEKCFKGVSPLHAHFYSTPTVPRVIWLAGVSATLNHSRPRSVFKSISHSVSARSLQFAFVTPAAFCVSAAEMPADYNQSFPAITDTVPSGFFANRCS